jgi:hypothetical protein
MVPNLVCVYLVQHFSGIVDKLYGQRHLTDGVGGAGQAWVIAADGYLYAVEHALGELVGFDVILRYQVDRAIQRKVVVLSGHDNVCLLYSAGGIYPEVMEQGAARRFEEPDAFLVIFG